MAFTGTSSATDVRDRLDAFRRRRGYLLPHQGALAAALPDLQDAYGPFYQTLVQDRHYLSDFEREFIWLVLLSAAGEALGTHHVQLFYDAGGYQDQAEAAFRLAGWASATSTFAFVQRAWQPCFPDIDASASYQQSADRLVAGTDGVDASLVRLALLSAHAARSDAWGIAQSIRACYQSKVDETRMVEALALAFWPRGINRLIEACDIWLRLMRCGEVKPSPPFQAWADTPDQTGCPVVVPADRRSPGG